MLRAGSGPNLNPETGVAQHCSDDRPRIGKVNECRFRTRKYDRTGELFVFFELPSGLVDFLSDRPVRIVGKTSRTGQWSIELLDLKEMGLLSEKCN
jgi:hypothetical protein